jgi:DNA-binding NarL/FixJ family response regulator
METRTDPVRIVIADDHTIFRQGLRKLLEAERGFRVVGEAADGAETVALVEKLRPDILLLDIQMPRRSGLEALQDLESSAGPVRTIILAAIIEKRNIVEALQLGARGVVLKESAIDVLIQSIRTVMAGHYWLGQDQVTDILRTVRELTQAAQGPPVAQSSFGLTPRELQVIARITAGYSNRDVAKELSLSERTVKHHLTHIFDKLGVYSRLELALFAVNHHLVEPDSPDATPAAPSSKSET